MIWAWVLAAFLGATSVLQAGLNRQIGANWGLATAAFLNSCVILVAAGTFFFIVRAYPESFPAFFRPKNLGQGFALWYLIPGLCGLFLVAGIPLAISKIGALKVFVLLIGAQIVASILWDLWVEGRPLSTLRVAGAAVSVIGAILVTCSD